MDYTWVKDLTTAKRREEMDLSFFGAFLGLNKRTDLNKPEGMYFDGNPNSPKVAFYFRCNIKDDREKNFELLLITLVIEVIILHSSLTLICNKTS